MIALVTMILGLANPTQAATTLTNNGNGTLTVSGLTFGDEVNICASNVSASTCSLASPPVLQYVIDTNGTYAAGSSVIVAGSGPTTTALPAGAYTFAAAGGGASESNVTIGSGSTSTPPAVTQGFGRPASGTCDAAAPATLNWGGAGSCGWGESWAQWMNGGAGGAVCTRTLVYSNNLEAWTVG